MTAIVHELILGGMKSGKSRTAEARAAAWLARESAPGIVREAAREAVLLASAMPGDAEMAQRIDRHRRERARRLPALTTVEVDRLPAAVRSHGAQHRLIIVDCLTLWATQCLMPLRGQALNAQAWEAEQAALDDALAACTGPVVLVSNEAGLGVVPLGEQARAAVDALGLLNQRVAARCARVTLMVAGQALCIKAPQA